MKVFGTGEKWADNTQRGPERKKHFPVEREVYVVFTFA